MESQYKVLETPFTRSEQENLLNLMLEDGYEFVSVAEATPHRNNWIFRKVVNIQSVPVASLVSPPKLPDPKPVFAKGASKR